MALLGLLVPAALMLVLRWDAPDGPVAMPWRFAVGGLLYALFVTGFIAAMISAANPKPPPTDRPHWRTSHRAVAPNGLLVAEIARALEHSMSNPTVGTLRVSDGLEIPFCSPAFLWSDDSRYLAVPQWEKCGLFRTGLRQRLVIVNLEHRTLYASPFVGWLLLPRSFENGKLEILASNRAGITFGWRKEPLLVEIPLGLEEFGKSAYSA